MKAKTSRGELYIEFRHVAPIVAQLKMGQKDYEPGTFVNEGDAGTYCTIKEGDRNGTIVAQGRSIIHPLDVNRFNREKGRVISLGNTLNTLFPGVIQKQDRTVLWEAYHSRSLPWTPKQNDIVSYNDSYKGVPIVVIGWWNETESEIDNWYMIQDSDIFSGTIDGSYIKDKTQLRKPTEWELEQIKTQTKII